MLSVVQTGLKQFLRPPIDLRCAVDRKKVGERGKGEKQKGGRKGENRREMVSEVSARLDQNSSCPPSASDTSCPPRTYMAEAVGEGPRVTK